MKLNSAAGNVCYVRGVARTVAFYEAFGLSFKLTEPTRATACLNWWWVDFHQLDEDAIPASHLPGDLHAPGAGVLVYFSVEDVQAAYEELTAAGIRPESEPYDLRGNRELVVVDPDRYRLVLFKPKR